MVVLVGVVAEVLLALREHHAVDLGGRVLAGEGDALVDLRQPGAEGADGPLQLGFLADGRLLVGEVPGL